MKTFIKWPGNKTRHIKHFIKYLPKQYNRYIEPFCASAALFLFLEPTNWIINDINNDIINVWKAIKNSPNEIKKYIHEFEITFNEQTNKILYCRNLTNNLKVLKNTLQRTVLYLILKNLVYMGYLVMKNKYYFTSFEFNHNKPFYKPSIFTSKYENNLFQISKFLNNTHGMIYNKDYKVILKKCKQNDFVFLDPPYVEDHKYSFNYNIDEDFSHFQKELFCELLKLDAKGVKWLMTQADTPYIRDLFKNYSIKRYKVYRGTNHKKKYELIIKNYT